MWTENDQLFQPFYQKIGEIEGFKLNQVEPFGNGLKKTRFEVIQPELEGIIERFSSIFELFE